MHFLLPPPVPSFDAFSPPTFTLLAALGSLPSALSLFPPASGCFRQTPRFLLSTLRVFCLPSFFPDTRGGKGLTTGRRKHPLSPRMHAPMDREREREL